jgi:hypothetical protein
MLLVVVFANLNFRGCTTEGTLFPLLFRRDTFNFRLIVSQKFNVNPPNARQITMF